jgi:hypothetical protein
MRILLISNCRLPIADSCQAIGIEESTIERILLSDL